MKMSFRTCYYAFNGPFKASHYKNICFMVVKNGVISGEGGVKGKG